MQWTDNAQSGCGVAIMHKFTGGPSGIRLNEIPTINKD